MSKLDLSILIQFVLIPSDARVACVALARVTAWRMHDLLDLDGEELFSWLEAAKETTLP